jgi:hypothetical protein
MQIKDLDMALKGALIDQFLIEEEKPRHKLMKLYQFKKKYIIEIYEQLNSKNNLRSRVYANVVSEDDLYRTIPTLATKYRIFRSMYEKHNIDELEYQEMVKKL